MMAQTMVQKKAKPRHFTEAEIKQAQQMDLLGYMESKGEIFKRAGKYYVHQEHDSLVICPEKAYFSWNSTGKSSKSCITLAMQFFELNFQEAVQDVLEHTVSSDKVEARRYTQDDKKMFDYPQDIQESTRTDALKKYLIDERKIDPDLVSELIQRKYIVQDQQQNVVYKWLDPLQKEKVVGAAKEGTRIIPEEKRIKPSMKRFKQVLTSGNQGFYFDVGKTELINQIYLFESPVDMMSYLTLKTQRGDASIQNARFLAMDGVKESVFFHHYMSLTAKLKHPIQPICCVDNDHAGHVFLEKLNAFEYLDSEGNNCLRNDIPYDRALTPELIQVYQEAGHYWQVDWKAIAAVHKAETNLTPQGKAANAAGIQKFFQYEKGLSDMTNQALLLPEAMSCARVLKEHSKENNIRFDQVYQEEIVHPTHQAKAMGFIETIQSYYEKYQDNQYFVVQEIPKDWNDILVAVAENRHEIYTILPQEEQHLAEQKSNPLPEK
ncbi:MULTISPECIES: DUF3991 domain-containing protein [Listeria]|uniref:DUF3991 domain-containing protein n=1 Tax=Listeria TaxID=1637 RepID=UPI000B58F244|nr:MULTISPECIES: DUF3991 domain-containing protein [Listeria]